MLRFPNSLKKINHFIATICGALILLTAILTFMEGTLRSVFSKPTIWSMDLCRYLMIWFTFLGAAYTFQEKGHVAVDFVREEIGKWYGVKVRRILSILAYMCSLIFLIVIFQYSIKMITAAIKFEQLTTAMVQIPTTYLLIAMPIGSFMMIVTIVFIIIDIISGGNDFI